MIRWFKRVLIHEERNNAMIGFVVVATFIGLAYLAIGLVANVYAFFTIGLLLVIAVSIIATVKLLFFQPIISVEISDGLVLIKANEPIGARYGVDADRYERGGGLRSFAVPSPGARLQVNLFVHGKPIPLNIREVRVEGSHTIIEVDAGITP